MSKLLDEYRRKRSADRTPEPMGAGAARPGVFVVQKHSATRMHYDLRLEWDGVLKSWAVPRGPHPDPAEKRLAMQTEDHPVEYADFEGVIPDGEYGAGPMIVWDRGLWRPVGDPREGVKAGKLLFELKGFKLKGMWTLVRIKGETGKEWLLIKETAVLDDTGRPVFQRLQKRALLTAPRDVERAATELPATLFLFDLLAFEDFDLRPLPLIERKKLLLQLVPAAGPIRAVDYVEGQGRALYASVRELGLEGIVAKRAQSAYRSGRFRDWQKIRIDRVGDFAVVGFTRAEGSRTGFGSVHVAVQKTEGLVYVGKVGGGFSEKELSSARAELEALRLEQAPCIGLLPGGRGHTWVQPKLVVEVRYKEITEDGLLRQPTFLRFRSDKVPAECIEPGAPPVTLLPREVPFSNLDKVFWPEEGYTKGDLIDYYRAVSPWLVPYLRDRPVVLTRYPDGIAGKSFFQKDAPDYVPAWMRTSRVWSAEGSRDIDFFVCEDVDTLLYVINLGTIPLHLWASRMAKPQHPDWSIIDLDPKTAPFEDVVTLANAVHELCDELGLPSFCKTSGQKGLHVLLPVGGQLTHAQSTTLAELIARTVESRFPKIATTERHIPSRKGRVYLDNLQNGHGKTIAGPFSARPVPGATVSMPLRWSEVNGKLDPGKFTLATAPARMKRLREDPLSPVLELNPDLQAALARLAEKLK